MLIEVGGLKVVDTQIYTMFRVKSDMSLVHFLSWEELDTIVCCLGLEQTGTSVSCQTGETGDET